MIKILAIDDKQNNLVVLTALLSSSFPDARIITAVSGREGIEKALTESPDVILLDLVMPIMGGIETCKRLKEDNFLKRIPVIMITATKTDSKTRTKALETGVEAFLSKPIDEAELTAQISSMIRLKKSENRVLLENERLEERKRAEETIIHERRMLCTLIDNLPDHIYVKDTDGRKVISNIADFMGLGSQSEEQVLGKTDLELFPGQTGKRGYADDMEVISSGKAIIGREEDFVNSRGKRRWSLTTKIPLHDKDGKTTGIVGIGHDITERKRAEKELQQSYAFSESLLKTIHFGLHIVDEAGTVLFLSDNFKRRFGEEAIGRKCWELYRDDKTKCSDCPLTRGITIGETEAYESHGILGNRIFEISHTGMMYKEEKAMLEIFQDITDRKENEEELIRAKEKAEESDRLKTAFLHNISHEIRTPMNAIVGFSALLGEPDIDVPTRQSYIEMIMQSSNHLLTIITDIVDISNIEANLVRIVKNGINLNTTLKALCNQFIPRVNEKKLSLTCETALEYSDAFILTDSTKLFQILSNLVNNALKFTNKGDIKLEYKVKENFLEFCVSDTGIGIPQEHHNRIFDRFYQVQNTISRIYEGTGLGLAISKAYVELLGGKIWLNSESGKGTTFYFTIPFEKSDSEGEAASGRILSESSLFGIRKRY